MMPSSFIDLERREGLCCCCCPGGYCSFSPFIPSAGQGCWGERGCAWQPRAGLAVPRTGVGLECPSLWGTQGRGGIGGHSSLCRADILTSAIAKSPTFSILMYN